MTLASCTSKSKITRYVNSFIKYDSLFKIVDSSNLEITRNTDSAAIEVLDKETSHGQRGLLRFDNNGNLRYYAFLYNNHNDASFILTYDSIGNYNRTPHEVVQWLFYTPKDSTVKFTFFLCALDRNYDDIEIKSGKFEKDSILLYQSNFTKLIGANISINTSDLDSTKKIYISGYCQDKLSKSEQHFIDSTIAQ